MGQRKRRPKPSTNRGRLPRVVYTWSYGHHDHLCRLSCGHARNLPKSSHHGAGLRCIKGCVHPDSAIVVDGRAQLLKSDVIGVVVLSGPTTTGYFDVEDDAHQLHMVQGYQLLGA